MTLIRSLRLLALRKLVVRGMENCIMAGGVEEGDHMAVGVSIGGNCERHSWR